jgi:hypothetical protein
MADETKDESVETAMAPDLVWDEEVRGLCVRAYFDGSQAFIFVYRIDGHQHFMRIGTTPVCTVDAARNRAKKLRSIVDEGGDPAGYKREPDKVPPVENLIEYIAAHPGTENS